jgi:hypothetical protein
MRPSRGGAARPADLMLGGAELVLGALSPNTEAELLGGGLFDEAASAAWLLASPGGKATPSGFGRDAQPPSLLPERGALRCIDGTHAAGCAACTPPSPPS